MDDKACRRQYQKKYYQENRKKILASRKILAKTNREKKRAYHRAYYLEHREEALKRHKVKYYENVEQERARSRKYREANLEKESLRQKAYYDSPRGYALRTANRKKRYRIDKIKGILKE